MQRGTWPTVSPRRTCGGRLPVGAAADLASVGTTIPNHGDVLTLAPMEGEGRLDTQPQHQQRKLARPRRLSVAASTGVWATWHQTKPTPSPMYVCRNTHAERLTDRSRR